jgi:hypothetical protein
MIKPKNLPSDVNQRAHEIARLLVEGATPDEIISDRSEHMAMIGRNGGLKGGRKRAEKLSSVQRKAIARKASSARWLKKDV